MLRLASFIGFAAVASATFMSAKTHPNTVTDAETGQAVIWATNQMKHHPNQDYNLCLQFVHDAYLYGAGVEIGTATGAPDGRNSAWDYWNLHPKLQHRATNLSEASLSEANSSDANPPVPPLGALVFWGQTPISPHARVQYKNPDGHVAISLGNGLVISSYEENDTQIHEFSIRARNSNGYPYLGWMMPPVVQRH